MPTLIVRLPDDRHFDGTIELRDDQGGLLFGPVPAHGESWLEHAKNPPKEPSGRQPPPNPTRDPTNEYGNTPTGRYRVYTYRSSGAGTRYGDYSYGPNGVFALDPITGDALDGKNNGRFGLLIHGGAPGKDGKLRPTAGCVRLSNDHMAALREAVTSIGKDNFVCSAEKFELVVREGSSDGAGDDEYDPPAGIQQCLAEPPEWYKEPIMIPPIGTIPLPPGFDPSVPLPPDPPPAPPPPPPPPKPPKETENNDWRTGTGNRPGGPGHGGGGNRGGGGNSGGGGGNSGGGSSSGGGGGTKEGGPHGTSRTKP